MVLGAFGNVEKYDIIARFTTEEDGNITKTIDKFKAKMERMGFKLTEVSTAGEEGIRKITTAFQGVGKAADEAAKKATRSFKSFQDDQSRLAEKFKKIRSYANQEKFQASQERLRKKYEKINKVVDKSTKSYKKNSVAMLGVMFAAMGVQRAMSSLLQPAMDAFGVFDIWNATMLTLFVPIMELMMPLFLTFTEWLMGLSDPTKQIIGGFVMLALAAASIIVALISFGLAASGWKQAVEMFGKLATWKASADFMTVMNMASKTVALYFLVEGISDLLAAKGKWQDTLSGILSIAAFLGFSKGGVTGGYIATGSLLVKILFEDVVEGKVKTWWQHAADIIGFAVGASLISKSAALALGISAPEFIAGVIVIGITFKLLKPISDLGFKAGKAVRQIYEDSSLKKGVNYVSSDILEPIASNTKKFIGQLGGKTGEGWYNGKQYQKKNDNGSWTGINKVNDFIWRPGESPTSMSKDDTVVGFKGDSPFGGGNITLNVTNNITVSDRKEIDRAIEINNRRLVDDLRRMVKA